MKEDFGWTPLNTIIRVSDYKELQKSFYDYMPKTQIFVRDMIFCIFILWILYFVVYFEDCLFNGKNYQENWLLFIGWISNFDFLVFFNVSLSKSLIDFDKFFLFLGCAGALKARRTLGHKKSRSHVFTGSILHNIWLKFFYNCFGCPAK